jgi:hypothetical protein
MASDIPTTADEPAGVRPGAMVGVVLTCFLIGAAETVLVLVLASLMTLGNVTMINGPAEIGIKVAAVPASIIVLTFSMLANKGLSDAFDTPSIMLVAWSAVFGLIGLAFLQSATRAPSGPFGFMNYAVAGTFFLMSAGGLFVLWQSIKGVRELDQQRAERTGIPPERPGFRAYQVATGLSLLAGMGVGFYIASMLGA